MNCNPTEKQIKMHITDKLKLIKCIQTKRHITTNILLCGFMHTLVRETEDFVLNPFGDGEPVQ